MSRVFSLIKNDRYRDIDRYIFKGVERDEDIDSDIYRDRTRGMYIDIDTDRNRHKDIERNMGRTMTDIGL